MSILRSLVVEQGDSITLIDPGLGLFDWLAPSRRIGKGAWWRLAHYPPPQRQILRPLLEQRGISPDRVSDIVLSHAHTDVIGAVSDFPKARVHALPSVAKQLAALAPWPAIPQFAHQPRVVPSRERASLWHTWTRHRAHIDGLELYLLELPGHAEGHAGVLIPCATGFVLYLGSAIGSQEELISPVPPAGPRDWYRILRAARPFECLVTRDRLRRLARCPPVPLTFVFARDPSAYYSVGTGPFPSIGYL